MRKKSLYIILFLVVFINANTPLNYINQLRVKAGAFKLKYNTVLSKAALKHAKYVSINQELSHYENISSIGYYAATPWNRITKAGFKTKLVVENISFFEPNYKASIDKLMGTVYHRLAFLYLGVDSLGYARYNNIYVYDMSNTQVANICSKHYKNSPMVIEDICSNNTDIVPKSLFDKLTASLQKRAKRVIIYPYKGQQGVGVEGIEETPKFSYNSFGYPITATFNNYYGNKVDLIEFKLFNGVKEVLTRVVTNSNDINNKIRKNTFVLVPINRLKRKTTYRVFLKARVNGKLKELEWSFTTL